LTGNINNIEAYRVNRDSVEGPATTAVGGRGGGIGHLTAMSILQKKNVDLQNVEIQNGKNIIGNH
jgi:hypothetical protein